MTIGGSAFRIAKRLTPPLLWDLMATARRRAYSRKINELAQRHTNESTGAPAIQDHSFAAAREAAQAIEGMFTVFSMAVIDSLLSLQEISRIAGNMMEMGVYRGRSAALLGRRLAPGERLLLVDIRDHLDRKAIEPFQGAVDYFVQSTAEFRKDFGARLGRDFRFIHIDASHEYLATFAELELADHMLAPRGIIAMDDYANLNYSQNIAAIFKYLYTSKTDLQIFLATDEKAYLCRTADLPFYAGFVLNSLVAEMTGREIRDILIARTDTDPEYSAFYARSRRTGEDGPFYGGDIYEKYFIEP